MKDLICVWIPIDTSVTAKTYKMPSIENQKQDLVELFAAEENTNEVEEEEPVNNFHHGHNQNPDPRDKRMKRFISEWIDVMSFSHNIANSQEKYGKPHIGEFTLTKFTCDRSPSLNHMALRGELVPHVVIRVQGKCAVGSNLLPIIEYELTHVKVTNVSISGGTGGKPVETLSLQCKCITHKNVTLNLETGDFENYHVSKWDNIKGNGSKTIYSGKKGPAKGTASLLELAKKQLLVDLDSQEPQVIALLKELGIVSEFEVPDTTDDEIDIENFYRIQISKDPVLFRVFEISKKDLTLVNVKKEIAAKLSIPVETIKDLYSYDRGFLIDNQKLLDISKTFIVQLTDNKFYGF